MDDLVDDDASPEVLEFMGVAANIHEDDTIIPDGGKLMVGEGYASKPKSQIRQRREPCVLPRGPGVHTELRFL